MSLGLGWHRNVFRRVRDECYPFLASQRANYREMGESTTEHVTLFKVPRLK